MPTLKNPINKPKNKTPYEKMLAMKTPEKIPHQK